MKGEMVREGTEGVSARTTGGLLPFVRGRGTTAHLGPNLRFVFGRSYDGELRGGKKGPLHFEISSHVVLKKNRNRGVARGLGRLQQRSRAHL